MSACLRGALCLKLAAVISVTTAHAQTTPSNTLPSQPPTGVPHRLPSMAGATMASHQANMQMVAVPASDSPQLRKLSVPAAHARSIATTLSMRYSELPGVTISPDVGNEQLVVMAPAKTHASIASDVKALVAGAVRQASSAAVGPLSMRLQNISWREFERDLKQAAGQDVPMTTRNNGNLVTFQMNVIPMQGTLVEVDRRQNQITVRAPEPALPGWQKMISALDSVPNRYDDVTQVHRLLNAEMAPVQRTMRQLRTLRPQGDFAAGNQNVFQNAVFQADQSADQNTAPPADLGDAPPADGDADSEGSGPLGDVQIEYVPELGQIIVKGSTRDVRRVMDLIKEIEDKAELTQPDSEVVPLKYADANAVAALLTQLYDDVLSSRQGDVSITSLDSPNSLLLIGRSEAIVSLKELIQKIDQPVEESSRLRVFRLQNASAIDAEEAIRTFFSERPGVEEELRTGLGPRVRISADYRTNSLIVSAAPRDMTEVTRLINDLDVQQTQAQAQLRVFPLNNAVAEDLATTLQDAFNGSEVTGSENVSAPSTSLSIVAIDSDERRVVDSGILAGATITADTGANAIVVRAPSTSMPLIAELIRQLDKAPGIDSLVKVFTIENGDAAQLALSLETLFGVEAGASGTSIGGANAAGLPSSTASADSSLVPLRFSTDIRTNSIVASGSMEDLEVVESILLRLDSEGFAERITEVIWLRNNDAPIVAEAITNYVNDRQQSRTAIQQYQTGLGPYDLLDRDIVAIAEFNSNSILLSVAPRLYEEVRTLIDRLDRRRPMVMIKVMLAEVNLDDAFEIGTELGLQDSLAFNRGQAVGPGAPAAGTPGFNFNDAGVPNVNASGRDSLASTAVSSFGLGQANPAIGYGGFVLNAASDSVSLLFRTLQDAGRAQILSRPQLMTTENTESLIEVGRQIARFRGSTVTNNTVTQNIEDITVGLILRLRPRVGSDGTITMQVDITRSDRDDANGTLVPDGDGGTVLINDIIDTTAQATLSVFSGQTVIMGGLIQTSRAAFSRRLPLISNIPIIGNLFKYDFESETRRELLVVLTPMLVTGEQDLEYIKQTESSKMSWCLADVVEANGDVGLSGGYGLWGPAIGPTIYPDLQPTVDGEVVVGELPPGIVPDRQRPAMGQPAGQPYYPPAAPAPAPGIAPAAPYAPGQDILDDGFQYQSPEPLGTGVGSPVDVPSGNLIPQNSLPQAALPGGPAASPTAANSAANPAGVNQSSFQTTTTMIGSEPEPNLPAGWQNASQK
ncbi:general secretion pathway protein GspD [Stieleria sp. TO1_6]|uniref:secretin N-terminal domain-containing protein n=1 Tax=Stieleria tagensis TaxID=2956795 RepID=UPI00209B49CB|nr:secretin N-terminal domain-containing protein [Stieleria tagensis]MCO8120933.1 general secretion pathway protein GspD [Stieleria tagensis]